MEKNHPDIVIHGGDAVAELKRRRNPHIRKAGVQSSTAATLWPN